MLRGFFGNNPRRSLFNIYDSVGLRVFQIHWLPYIYPPVLEPRGFGSHGCVLQGNSDDNGGDEEDPGEDGEDCLEGQIQDERFQEMLCEMGVLEEEDGPCEPEAHHGSKTMDLRLWFIPFSQETSQSMAPFHI